MRVRVREIGWIMGALLVVGLPAGPVHGQEEEMCPNPPRHKFSDGELKAKLKAHEEWLNRGPKGSGRAILCNADLSRADLSGADLSKADLSEANLSEANLSGAFLILADLSGAFLNRADLSGADLSGADLRSAYLMEANLSGADLNATNLSGANLQLTDLSGATLRFADLSRGILVETNLKEAYLFGVTLTDATYQPITAPAQGSVSGLKGLTKVKFGYGKESGLVLLREVLRESGLRNLEREATFVIERGRTRHALAGRGEREEYDNRGKRVKKDIGAQIEGVFKLVFFEWTTDYGLHYGRPLLILVILIPVMALGFYLWPLVTPQNPGHQHGIYEVLPKGRLVTREGRDETADDEAVERLTLPLGRALLFALYFSLLSSSRIGWRDLNVGSWLTRLQLREYDLRGRGWVRLVSGAQSLTSVYLLAMWALTYFGRPFQ